jgi:hypothetical protein
VTQTTKPTVILAGPDEGVLTRSAYPALSAAGFQVAAVTDTPEELRDVAAVAQADLAIVCADVAVTPDEALELLAEVARSVRLAVILPAAWESRREQFTGLPNLLAGFSAPANWPALAARLVERLPACAGRQKTPPAEPRAPVTQATAAPAAQATGPVAPTAQPPPHSPRQAAPALQVRLGFWGTRGGAGTSSAALAAARALAAEGHHVGLFDATLRGDLHLMAGMTPTDQPISQGGVTFFLRGLDEETARGFSAVIVDGGRARGRFNAEWIAVSKPLSEERLRRLAGLPPLPREKGKAREGETAPATTARTARPAAPRQRTRGLLSVEITD